ncbi:MAG TPA: VapC toxin family PIN domain ribonuclease [Allosphingosinicella sp.]|nr:VapC toxin family PIN domain ribonuclease [Allosphingosinicella sp.]
MATANIIADSSIWIDHINKGDAELATQLKRRRIVLHPMIIGEVALGPIANRRVVLGELQVLPQARPASHAEVMAMIEWLQLFNCGIGYVDAHLLASARQLPNGQLWTRDKRLRTQAERLGLAFVP